MQLSDLVKPIDQQTDEELLERLRAIRHNRTVERPAAKRHAKKAVKKISNAKVSKISSLVEGLNQDEIQKMLLLLGAE